MSKPMRRVLAAMMVAVLLYAAFAAWSDYSEVASRLSEFSWLSFIAACALAVGNYLLRYLKWEYYLSRLQIHDVPKLDSLLIFLSGFVLTITPGKVGEVFKSVLLLKTYRIAIARSAPIVVAERLTDTIGVTLLIAVGIKGLAIPGAKTLAAIGACLVAGCMIVIMSRRLSETTIRTVERMPGPLRRFGPKIRQSWDSLRTLATPNALLIPTILSVAAWACEGIALYVILVGFGAHVPIVSAVFFYSTATLAGGVSPGGLGITEGALSGQLMLLGGVTQSIATGSMILVRFATLWFAVILGFAALGLLRARHPELKGSDGARPAQPDASGSSDSDKPA